MRRPEYVPRGTVYVSTTKRVKRRHGERRRRAWVLIAALIGGVMAIAVMVVALAHLDREASAGWPNNVHPIPAPAARSERAR